MASRSTSSANSQRLVGLWEFILAEDRPRAVAGIGVDAVICARRLS
jgi:hypothetical protein